MANPFAAPDDSRIYTADPDYLAWQAEQRDDDDRARKEAIRECMADGLSRAQAEAICPRA